MSRTKSWLLLQEELASTTIGEHFEAAFSIITQTPLPTIEFKPVREHHVLPARTFADFMNEEMTNGND